LPKVANNQIGGHVLEYLNARKVLPTRLIAELQKYASGQLVYIPKDDEEGRAGWGQLSGARRELDQRNRQICELYQRGINIENLSMKFFLSPETIKKIIYSKK